MQPTTRDGMLSHPDSHPRPLTPREEARILWALRDDPPIYRRRRKVVAAPAERIPAKQPWEVRLAA